MFIPCGKWLTAYFQGRKWLLISGKAEISIGLLIGLQVNGPWQCFTNEQFFSQFWYLFVSMQNHQTGKLHVCMLSSYYIFQLLLYLNFPQLSRFKQKLFFSSDMRKIPQTFHFPSFPQKLGFFCFQTLRKLLASPCLARLPTVSFPDILGWKSCLINRSAWPNSRFAPASTYGVTKSGVLDGCGHHSNENKQDSS